MASGNLNEVTKWSTLSRLAGGRLTKLTIAAPFLAFIILHNEPLQPYLGLAESWHPSPVLQVLALARFDIFYLGLIIIGAAVGVYSMFSPPNVAGHDGYDAYIEFKESTKTSNGVVGSFKHTLDEYTTRTSGDARGASQRADSEYPARFLQGLESLFEVLVRDAHEAGSPGAEALMAEHGHVKFRETLDLLQARRYEERPNWEGIFKVLPPYSIDVYRLEYLRYDYSRPRTRLVVFALLIFGMAVVLVPTVITTYLVIGDLWNAIEASATGSLPGTTGSTIP